MIRLSLFTLLVIATSLAGCGSGSGNPGATPDGQFLICATDTRATPYQPGMQATPDGTTPRFALALLTSDPGPPVKGLNKWIVEVRDLATGLPADGLDISVRPWMPDHMHGTTDVAVIPEGSGRYTLQPVYLYMSGFWQVKFTILDGMDSTVTQDTATIPICIS